MPEKAHRLLDTGHKGHYGLFFDGSVLASAQHAPDNFLPIERLAITGTLHDGESYFFDAFECGEPLIAGRALPAPADGYTIFGQPRVDYAIVISRAEGASHKTKLVELTQIFRE
jgi:hypothetical protein